MTIRPGGRKDIHHVDNREFLIHLIRLILLFPFFLWGFFSLWWCSFDQWICLVLSIIYTFSHFAVFILAPRRKILPVCLLLFLFPLILFFLVQPSNDKNWQPDVASTPFAEIDGDKIVLHNFRNCDYITETEYTPRFETRTYELSKLRSIDLILTDWGLKYVAHTMISFGFEGDEYLCFSVEARKEMGESYSAVKGFFRQYELIYIAGDERDLVRLRAAFRKGEDVYLYRLRAASIEKVREFLLSFLRRINFLREDPEWYNALTQNCMTSIFKIAWANSAPEKRQFHWSTILNGFADRHAYESGTIDTTLPFDALKRRSRINEQALAAGNRTDFSREIRRGLPGMTWKIGKGG